MLLHHLFLVATVFSQADPKPNIVYSREEFIAEAKSELHATPLISSVTPANCTDLRLDDTATTLCHVMQAELNHSRKGLLNALHLYTDSKTKAHELLEKGVDKVVIVMDRDPSCSATSFYDIHTVAATLIGPGSVAITEAHTTQTINQWIHGNSSSLTSPSFLQVGTITKLTAQARERSLMKIASLSTTRSYNVPSGTTCTPSMLTATAVCREANAHFYLTKNGISFEDKRIKLVDSLLPAFGNNYFHGVFGCIDYSKSP